MKIILDLCGGSGAWSRPYAEAGYEVRLITQPDLDVRLLHCPGPVHGILAAPPCTCFARAGAWVKRPQQAHLDALAVVDACLRFVVCCRPQWWALENPVGMLRRWLGPPALYFQPYEFGDAYSKRTCLWGNFNPPAKSPVEPTARIDQLVAGQQKARRSITPPGFARAFFAANP